MSDAILVADDAADGPVSVVVTRRIKPGCERAYEELVKGIHEAIKGFDGYLGSHILRPSSPDHPEYRIIFRFDTAKHLRTWEVSAERREWLERMSGLLVGTPVYQALSGFETWFTLPGGGPIVPPPRYKMMLVTWLAVFPLLTAFNYAPMWDELFPAEQARIIRLLVERIDLSPDGMQVRLRAEGLQTLVEELRSREARAA